MSVCSTPLKKGKGTRRHMKPTCVDIYDTEGKLPVYNVYNSIDSEVVQYCVHYTPASWNCYNCHCTDCVSRLKRHKNKKKKKKNKKWTIIIDQYSGEEGMFPRGIHDIVLLYRS